MIQILIIFLVEEVKFIFYIEYLTLRGFLT